MPKVLILKGLPASGKSTYARELMEKEPGKWKRINKDDLRNMLDDGKWSKENESHILRQRDEMMSYFLRQGQNIIIDDTNLSLKHESGIRMLVDLPDTVEVKTFDTPVDECIRRDALRTGREHVGEKVIRDMARVFNWPPKPTIEPYQAVEGRDEVIICDIDGTIAEKGDRSAFDWGRVGNDKPRYEILKILEILYEKISLTERYIILVSGRDQVCESETRQWLSYHNIPYDMLYMRPKGDNRPDTVIKREIFDNHIRGKYNVLCVLDDRNKVVKMWRELGLTCLQVADGDF